MGYFLFALLCFLDNGAHRDLYLIDYFLYSNKLAASSRTLSDHEN